MSLLTATPTRSRNRTGALAALGSRAQDWRAELVYFGLAYLVYLAARWVFTGDPAGAQANASWIWSLERSTGTAIEASVQGAFDSGAANWVLSHVYLAAQFVVLPAALVWLYRRSAPVYRALRTTVIATWMISVPIFALFPVAPPRLADLGVQLADTVSDQAAVALTGSSTIFYNPYAAVPSLHVGFAFAVSIAAVAVLRAPWARFAAALWGPLVTLTVVSTANHYVFDVLAGILVTAAGFAVWQASAARRARPAAPSTRARPPAPRVARPCGA